MNWIRGRAYSQDLRQRVLAASDRGLSARKVAALFEVSVSYVLRARQRRTRTGEVGALKARQVQVRRLAAHGDALRETIAMRQTSHWPSCAPGCAPNARCRWAQRRCGANCGGWA